MSGRGRKSLSRLTFGHLRPVSSASLEAWNAALQASSAPPEASSAPLQASSASLEAWSASLEASGARFETSNGLIEAWNGASALPDGAPRRSSASLQAWNAALQASNGSPQASSGVPEVRSASVLATRGTLQVRGRLLPLSPGTRERPTATFIGSDTTMQTSVRVVGTGRETVFSISIQTRVFLSLGRRTIGLKITRHDSIGGSSDQERVTAPAVGPSLGSHPRILPLPAFGSFNLRRLACDLLDA